MSDPKGFLKFKREEPGKRSPQERVSDWNEFSLPVPEVRMREQASRCMDCGVPFCHSPPGCPVKNLIPEWNRLVSDGRWDAALESLHSTNNFPEFTGKLCPAPCESACVLSINSAPVTIRTIESKIIERGFSSDWVRPQPAGFSTGKSVAIVGSGPAGLAAAQQLARLGHRVRVYEKAARVGGLLRYGIPDFKMEKSVLDRRLLQLDAEGVEFYTGVEIGRNLSLAELKAENHAVCLTIGAENPRDLPIPGRELAGVHFAMDFLIQQNQHVAGESALTSLHSGKKNVVILGGGDTGSDCLGTAHRQGCASVTQLEIMPRPPEHAAEQTPWPQWPLKLRSSHAHEEGGRRDWSVMTQKFVADPVREGHVHALRCVRVKWSEDGKKFEEILGTEFDIPADLVLLATGFTGVRDASWLNGLGVTVDAQGRIPTDLAYMTREPGVFSAGDAKRGASLIVWAIAEGREMATSVDRYLRK